MQSVGGTSLFRNRNFLLVWGGQTISVFGSQMGYIALFWWVYDTTGSAAALASVAIATAITRFLAGPIAGTFIDRVDRRKVMLCANVVNGLAMSAAGIGVFSGYMQVWHVYILGVISAGATLVHRSALLASIPTLVSKEQLTRANSLNQIGHGISGLLGPTVGGFLVAALGSGPTMWIDASTFFIAAGSLLIVAFASPKASEGEGFRSTAKTAVSGFRFLGRERRLLVMVGLFGICNFMLAPTSVLIPVMARDVLMAGSQGLGFLTSALAGGMLAGGAFTWLLKRVQRHGIGIILGLVVLGVSLAWFGVSGSLIVAVVALGVVGFAVGVLNVFESVILQLHVPDEMRGRTFAAVHALTQSLRPLSLAAIGGLLIVLSAPIVLAGCGLAVGVAGLLALGSRGVRKL